MCLLSFYPDGVMPDPDALRNGAALNDDGHGWAIVTDRRLIVRHGMDAEHTIASFVRARGEHPDGPALFHSRFATHGTIGTHNCHPFRLGGDRRTVVAHNGILPKAVQPDEGDRRCDTRVAAEDFLPDNPVGTLDTKRGRTRLARWFGPGNKLVILTLNPRYPRNYYLLNADRGIWDDTGIWYSNHDYLTPLTHYRIGYGTGFGTALDNAPEWTWPGDPTGTTCSCYGMPDSINPDVGYCAVCGACADCGEPDGYCCCYTPSRTCASTG